MTTKKADYIWFNGEMVRWEDAKVHVMSHALHYGTSVFEGIRCYDSHKGPVVFRHREHMQRLHDSAKIYRFPVSQSIDELMEACRDVIRKNNLTSAYIRPLIFVGDVGMGVNPPAGYSTDVIIAAFPWGAYLGAEALEQGIDAMVSSWNRAAPNTIPTAAKAGGNYLSSLLVGSEARRHGSPPPRCRVLPVMPSSNWRKSWELKCVSRCCRANHCTWRMKCLCLGQRQKSRQCAA